MSVGGKVIETIICDDKVWVNTLDRRDECAIYVEKTPESRSISEGDTLWWQGNAAYWTARGKAGQVVGKGDYPLKRIGFSGVARPKAKS